MSTHGGVDRQRGAERLVAVAYCLSTLAAVGLAVVYWVGGHPQLEGALLGVALGGIGVGMVMWAKAFLPHDEVAEDRGRLESSEEELAAFSAAFQQGATAVGRRRLLLGLLGGAVAALAAALVFPIRSLGPRPGKGLFGTAFRSGVRLVTAAGVPLRPEDLVIDGVVTVWPEGFHRPADAPALLIRVANASLFSPAVVRPWTVDGLVAYSKLCTHLACPVGLYQAEDHQLLCPCHQSAFDVLDGARPVAGPATRPLPQLPISTDPEGFLIATGDYEEPVGAGFWNRPE